MMIEISIFFVRGDDDDLLIGDVGVKTFATDKYKDLMDRIAKKVVEKVRETLKEEKEVIE